MKILNDPIFLQSDTEHIFFVEKKWGYLSSAAAASEPVLFLYFSPAEYTINTFHINLSAPGAISRFRDYVKQWGKGRNFLLRDETFILKIP